MFLESNAEPRDSAPFTFPTYRQETLRHILLGDYAALMEAINQMAALGHCDRIAQTPYPRATAANTSAL
jgi:predicted membrane chloride channel (bestrophin family)